MADLVRLGIIICDRYRLCAGGKCFRALRNREGAFSIYQGQEVELVGYATCGGCPGGNIEYAPAELMKNGAGIIHFATGMIVGYPPCPYLTFFRDYIELGHNLKVIIGTHPIPQEYYEVHRKLKTWDSSEFRSIISNSLADEPTRLAYD
jgi:predicted metal-binding protein